MSNQEIAKLLRNIAATYAIKDENKYRFQIIAYQKASDAIEHANVELKDLYREGNLEKVPGIGPSIKSHLEELFSKGKVKHFEHVTRDIPSSVFPLLDIPSFGPKKAHKLVTAFKLNNEKTVIEDIEKIAKEGKIAHLDGFGQKSQDDILRAIDEYKQGTTKSNRMVLPYAHSLAQKMLEYLKKSKDVITAEPLGSLRRMAPTVGDIDIAVTSNDPRKVLEYFTAYPHKERVIEKGPATASLLISGGKHVDLLVLKPENFGSLLQHFTGSKHHNVALREYALKKGMSLSEYGIKTNGRLKTFNSEKEFYKFLGLDWIPPEIRENLGEIELSRKYDLPKLVEIGDIKGDLHIHSNFPIEPSHDMGGDSMENMLIKAEKLGYEYLGFSEHNPSNNNHSKQEIYSILSRRNKNIEQLNKSNKYIRVINLLEIDILPDGNLALDDKALEFIDAAIVSVHSVFSMPKSKMTKRVLEGLSHPKAKILAHPTGRLLNSRPGYEIDWNELFDFAVTNNKALEINAWPTRLDLPDMLVKEAKEKGVKLVINTDSHALSHMDNMFYGVAVARRGWCEKKDILNTLPYDKFVEWLKK